MKDGLDAAEAVVENSMERQPHGQGNKGSKGRGRGRRGRGHDVVLQELQQDIVHPDHVMTHESLEARVMGKLCVKAVRAFGVLASWGECFWSSVLHCRTATEKSFRTVQILSRILKILCPGAASKCWLTVCI